MPTIVLSQADLQTWGALWLGTAGSNGAAKAANCFDKKQGMDFGKVFDMAFGRALAEMLGGINVVEINAGASLLPPQPNCVEVGGARIIGGIRPQNFDAAYRPDGQRVVLDRLCCANGLTVKVPLPPDRLIPRFRSRACQGR